MIRKTLLAAATALATGLALAAPVAALAEGPPPTMLPGQRIQLGAALGERTVRMVMFNDGGATVDIVYDMAPGQPQSARVLRLENVNGMLQVIYDYSQPTTPLASAGIPRLVQQGGGMYEVVYDPK